MTSTARSTLKKLVEAHIIYLTEKLRSGSALTDGEHAAIALHSLAYETNESADALGRIYMTLDKQIGKAA